MQQRYVIASRHALEREQAFRGPCSVELSTVEAILRVPTPSYTVALVLGKEEGEAVPVPVVGRDDFVDRVPPCPVREACEEVSGVHEQAARRGRGHRRPLPILEHDEEPDKCVFKPF